MKTKVCVILGAGASAVRRLLGRNQDKANAVMSRLERVRFILVSKEGEEHAKRGVVLGWLGVLLGLLSVALGVLSLR